MTTNETCECRDDSIAFPVGASVATGLVDAGIVAGAAYAVTKKFSMPLFVGVAVAAASVAFFALGLLSVAKEAEDLVLYD